MRVSIKVLAGSIISLFATWSFAAALFDGEWQGTLQCGPALRNPSPAFSAPVTMNVASETVKLTRNTNAVTESLTGRILRNGHASLSGSGRRMSGESSWTTEIDGTFLGTVF